MDKMREEFEAWCSSHGYTLRPAETNCGIIIDGQYGNQRVQIAWDAWQASRAALCVNLPKQWYDDGLDSDLMEAHHVGKALDAAGVRYK